MVFIVVILNNKLYSLVYNLISKQYVSDQLDLVLTHCRSVINTIYLNGSTQWLRYVMWYFHYYPLFFIASLRREVPVLHHWHIASTVYPKKYAHGFVVLCFVVVMQSFIMNSHEVFIHIHQGYFLALGQSLDCHSASEVSLMDMGKSVNV